MKLWQRLLEKRFEKKLSPGNIEEHFRRLSINHCIELREYDHRQLRVSCVQRKIKPVKKVEDYIDLLHHFVKEAVEEDSQLVVFPEYNFLDLLGIIPGFIYINRYLEKKAKEISTLPEQATNKDTKGLSPGPIFQSIATPMIKAQHQIYSYLSKSYRIYIYTGSYIARVGDKLINTGTLYDPDGKVVGNQSKLHLTPFEEEYNLSRGDTLSVFSLPIGKVAFPVCMDATYFETFRIAREIGAEIVIIPIANPEEYNLWKALKGIWPRVQESYVYGVKSALTGWFAGMHYTGKAGIFAPLAITDNQDGIIALSASHEGDQLVTGTIDLLKLAEERGRAEYYGDVNLEFEKEYVDKTYTKEKRDYHEK